ncbi:MAG: hypothetical protein NT167_31450, partial [Verrucomicrobia bacterium]|nr:hypothetical protein [Verrucomicrobiota bacterium]
RVQSVALAESPHANRILGVKTAENYATGFRAYVRSSEVVARGIVAKISGATIWRWLDQEALRPWQHRSWIFPRDPQFEQKAGRVLDLYQGYWQDQPLGSDEYVI